MAGVADTAHFTSPRSTVAVATAVAGHAGTAPASRAPSTAGLENPDRLADARERDLCLPEKAPPFP